MNVVRLAGNIKNYVAEWERLTHDQFILSAVSGFKIQFKSIPVQIVEPRYGNLPQSEHQNIDISIDKLLASKAIEKCDDESGQYVSTVFTVPKSDGGCRFVINLKKLNEFVDSPHFKMEDIRMVISLMQHNSYMVVLDQCEAFHRIAMVKEHRKYLRFRWKEQLYQFTCLPFGLNVSPWLFTKMMKPVMASLRFNGYESVSYLDDCLLLAQNESDCIENRQATIELFTSLGLFVNYKKSQLVPSRRVKYLGFIFDSSNLSIHLPQNKVEMLKKMLRSFLFKEIIIVQELAELIGHLTATTPAIKYSPLYLRELECLKIKALQLSGCDYNSKLFLSDRAKTDIKWWIGSLDCPWQLIQSDLFDITLTTDSSGSGWGASDSKVTTKGQWSAYQKTLHINVLELLGVYYGLKSLVQKSGINILLRVDNVTAMTYINRFGGCRASQCHEVARMIWQYCEKNNLYIRASYVNTKLNCADSLSREKRDVSDFMLNNLDFGKICKSFFIPTRDLFATHLTKQCSKFVSWLPDPESEAVDAFSIKWNSKFYAFPPFNMIAKVLRKIEVDQVYGIVVVPNWPTQPWYPRFLKMKRGRTLKIKPTKNMLFCPYENRSHELSMKISLEAAVLYSSHLAT